MCTNNAGIRAGILFALVVMCWQPATGAQADSSDFADRRCGDCHLCTVPSVRDTCLKASMRAEALAFRHLRHSLGEAPDSLVLATLTETFAPVCFDHKSHAKMAEMGSGCVTCHHYSPEGEIPPCSKCHEASPASADQNQISLEAVYHQQCRSCHQDWGSSMSCAPCHRTHGETFGTQQTTGSSGKSADSVPVVVVPVSKVYETNQPDTFVTFQHMEHIELFELQCTDCHQHEQCRRCHTQCKTGMTASAAQDVGVTCVCCHSMERETSYNDRCVKCHDVKPHPPVFHEIVGKSIPECLGKATCESCHDGKSVAH